MLVYLDMCCLKRPFDDQSQARIHLESEAVLSLLAAEDDALRFVRSPALGLENDQNPLPARAAKVSRWLGGTQPSFNPATIAARTTVLIGHGFGNFDAIHVASAEAAGAHVLATCDDRFIAAARRVGTILSVRVVSVLDLAKEVLS